MPACRKVEVADGCDYRLGLAGFRHAYGVADRGAHRHGGVHAAQWIEACQGVAADIAGDARARGAHRHEARGVRAARAQHRRAHQRFRGPLIISLQTRRQYAGLFKSGTDELRRQFAGTREEAFAFDLKSERADFFFNHRLEFLDHEDAVDRFTIAAEQFIRQRPGCAELQYVCVGERFAHIRIAGACRDDAKACIAFLPTRDRRFGKIRFQARLALDHCAMARPGIGRDHDVLRGLLDERARRRLFAIADRDRTAGMRKPGRAAHDHRRIEGLRQIERKAGEIKRLLRIARLEHRHGREHAVNSRVLLVLRAVNPGIVAHGEDQPAVHADISLRHECIGGDIEADMLHGGERAPAGKGSADRNIERDLFVGRPLGVQVFGRIVGQCLEDFGARRAGIGGSDLHAGFPGAARDRFVAGQRPYVTCRTRR